MSIWELPEGWVNERLGTLIEIHYGRGLPARDRDAHGGYSVYGSNGNIGVHSTAITNGKTLIIGRKGSIGEIHYSEAPCWPIDTTYYIENFPANIDSKYLYWFLKSQDFKSLDRAAAIPGIRREDLYKISVPLPYATNPTKSLETQRAIVTRLELIFQEVREMQYLHDKLMVDFERLRDSVVNEIFTSGLENGWSSERISTIIIGKPQYGTSIKASTDPKGVPIIRMGNISSDGRLSLENIKYVDLAKNELNKYLLHQGDILFNRTNSAELVGKSAVYQDGPEAVFASYLIRIRVDQEKFDPKFIVMYINSAYGRRYIQGQLVRAIGQVNVNAQKLAAMPVLVPPSLLEQQQIVSYVERINQELQAMITLQAQDGERLKQLEQAFLWQAFRGEL